MFRISLLLLLIIISNKSIGQQKLDTIFYDIFWKETKVKDSIEYYRIAIKTKKEFIVNDYYYSNHKLQMSGTFNSLDK